MSVLPAPLFDALTETLGQQPQTAWPASGGMINQAAIVKLVSGRVFVKWNDRGAKRAFYYEADGLRRIRETKTLRVPEVIAVHDRETAGEASYLVLEYLEPTPPRHSKRFAETFADNLAELHRHPVPDRRFGLEHPNFIGSMPQWNEQRAKWAEFYRDCRIVHQTEIAKTFGRMPAHRERLIMQVCERMDELFAGLKDEPSLIHGDLWSGNFLCSQDVPIVFDPAVYYGHREVELAFIELFGGFPPGFMDAYRVALPVDPGYERRRALPQLYPLLVHLNHFGEPYGQDVDRVCRLYVS